MVGTGEAGRFARSMQALSGFQQISRTEPRRIRLALIALGALVALVALVAARPAGAGKYPTTVDSPSLACKSGGELFARFLEDFDGILPSPWKVSPEASGKA